MADKEITINLSDLTRWLKKNILLILLLAVVCYLLLERCEAEERYTESNVEKVNMVQEVDLSDCKFTEAEKKQLIDENLIFAFQKTGWNYDGDVIVDVQNKSKSLTFSLSMIGMRHSDGDGNDKKYNNQQVSIILSPGEKISVEVAFPSLRKSYGRPYAILDSTEIEC